MFVRWACPLVEIGMTAFVSSKMPRKFSMARLLTRGTGKVTRLNHCLYCMLHASAEQVVHVPSRGEPRSPLDTASFHVRVAGLSWQDSTLHGGGSLSKFIRIALTVSARPCCSKVCPHGSLLRTREVLLCPRHWLGRFFLPRLFFMSFAADTVGCGHLCEAKILTRLLNSPWYAC